MSRGTQYLKENLPKLSLDIREAIVNSDYLGGLRTIQEQNKLHLDQGEELEDLTFKLMLGEVSESEFLPLLAKNLNIQTTQANDLVKQVDELVMAPIRKELENIQAEDAAIVAEDKAIAANISTSDVVAEEDHHTLAAADILAGIEHPDPSVGEIHATTTSATTTSTPSVPIASTPAPIQTNSTASILAAVANNANNSNPNKPVDTTEPAVPVSPAVAALDSKLTEHTVSKPQEIKTSLDPYREKF